MWCLAQSRRVGCAWCASLERGQGCIDWWGHPWGRSSRSPWVWKRRWCLTPVRRRGAWRRTCPCRRSRRRPCMSSGVIAWFWEEPLGARRRKPGHVARRAPHPFSRQAVRCAGDLTQQRHAWQGALSLRMTLRKRDIGRDLNMQRPAMNGVQFSR